MIRYPVGGSGSGSSLPVENITSFGAVADWNGMTGTDNAAAINAAAAAAAASGMPVFFPAGNWRINSTVLLPCSVIAQANAQIFCTGAAASTIGLLVASANTTSPARLNIENLALPYVNNALHVAGGGWAGSGTGIKILNIYKSKITLLGVFGFSIGLAFEGNGDGCGLNTVLLGEQGGNLINLDLYGGQNGGFCNNSIFIGGSCGIDNSELTAGTRGIRIRSSVGGLEPNNHLFLNTDLEGFAEHAVELNGAIANKFVSARFENSGSIFLDAASGVNTTFNNFDAPLDNLLFTYGVGVGTVGHNTAWIPDAIALPVGGGIALMNTHSSSDPVIQLFSVNSTTEGQVLNIVNNWLGRTDWLLRLSALSIMGKAAADNPASPRILIEFNNGNMTWTGTLAHQGSTVGFFNTSPGAKPTVTGSKAANAALSSLMTALAGLGLVTDSTS